MTIIKQVKIGYVGIGLFSSLEPYNPKHKGNHYRVAQTSVLAPIQMPAHWNKDFQTEEEALVYFNERVVEATASFLTEESYDD